MLGQILRFDRESHGCFWKFDLSGNHDQAVKPVLTNTSLSPKELTNTDHKLRTKHLQIFLYVKRYFTPYHFVFLSSGHWFFHQQNSTLTLWSPCFRSNSRLLSQMLRHCEKLVHYQGHLMSFQCLNVF